MQTLSGNEHFSFDGRSTGFLLNDFWAWQASDLLNNTLRGTLAEFIVAKALEIDTGQCRQDWEAYDLHYNGRWKIEVKSSARLQSWAQKAPSRIQFSIRPARSWTPEDGYSETVTRQSDLYVFCLFACEDREKANPMLLNQWEFYILPTVILNERCTNQRSITLPSLLSLNPHKADYGILKAKIRGVLAELLPPASQ